MSFGNLAKFDPFGYCVCHDMIVILQKLKSTLFILYFLAKALRCEAECCFSIHWGTILVGSFKSRKNNANSQKNSKNIYRCFLP